MPVFLLSTFYLLAGDPYLLLTNEFCQSNTWTPSRLPLYFPVSVLELKTTILLPKWIFFRPGLQNLFQNCETVYMPWCLAPELLPWVEYRSTVSQTERLLLAPFSQTSSFLTSDYSPIIYQPFLSGASKLVSDLAWIMTFSVLSILSLALFCTSSLYTWRYTGELYSSGVWCWECWALPQSSLKGAHPLPDKMEGMVTGRKMR